MSITHVPVCQGCGKLPEECPGYIDALRYELQRKPTDQECRDYCLQEEGTLNPKNNHFLCDACYIAAGMPSSPTGWKCP